MYTKLINQGVPDHLKISPEPFSVTYMITVLCLKVLDNFEGKKSPEDMKNTLQSHGFGTLSANKLAYLQFY